MTLSETTLIEMLDSGETRWFARRRLKSLASAGLIAGSYWNPDLHPRGPDGKFIEKWGWIRWLVDGKWMRGQVVNILPEGKIIARPDLDPDHLVDLPTSRVYGLPTPKGNLLHSPDPTGSFPMPDQWEKVGDQAGSNPGGFYTTVEPVEVQGNISAEVVNQIMAPKEASGEWALIDYPSMPDEFKKALSVPDYYIGTYTDENGDFQLIDDNMGGTTVGWMDAIKAPDFKLWVTSSEEEFDAVGGQLAHHGDIPENTKFYVKHTKGENHRANEVLANQLYELAGVPMPDLYYGDGMTVASKILKSGKPEGGVVEPLSAGENRNDPDILRQIRENMAVDAWLANWDVAGKDYDNIMIVDGLPVRIDTGGSLEFRAMGTPKGADFGDIVTEIEVYQSPKNPSASHVFKDVTDAEIRKGVVRIAAISPKTIDNYVAAAGVSPDVAVKLQNRRAYLLTRYGVEDPFKFYTPPELTVVSKQAPKEEWFWNPITDQWQPGTIKQSATDIYTSMTHEIEYLYSSGDPDLSPVIGDLVVSESPHGLYRVTSIGEGRVLVTSDLQEDNETVFDLPMAGVRVVAEDDSEKLRSLNTRRLVASTNDQLRLYSLEDVFRVAWKESVGDKGPIFTGPYLDTADWEGLTDLAAGSYVFHRYLDPENDEHDEVFRVKGSTDDSVSLVNVINGKEHIISKNDWETDPRHGMDWGIPDLLTQDLTDGLLKRDNLINAEGALVATIPKPSGDLDEVVEPMENPEPTAFSTSPIEMEVALEELGVVESMASEYGVNVNISTGEAISQKDMYDRLVESVGGQLGVEEIAAGIVDEETYLDQYVGQTIILSNDDASVDEYVGVWLVTGVATTKLESYDSHTLKAELRLRSPNGTTKNFPISTHGKEGRFIQFANDIDASQPQPPWTHSPSGALILEGVQVGVWDSYEAKVKSYYWTSYEKRFRATIWPEHSITGKVITDDSRRRKDLPEMQQWLIPPPPIVHKKAKATKDAIFAAADLKERKDFKDGQWVAAPDGFVGLVENSELPQIFGAFPSSVRVVSEDGKARILNANLLVEIDGPAVVTDIPYVEDLPAPGKVGPYWPLKYGDGNDIYVGQIVTGGKGAKVITGKVAWVTPPGGKQAAVKPYALVIDSETGKEIKKSLTILSLVEDVKVKPTSAEGNPLSTKADIEIAIDFTPEQKAGAAAKYINPDGKTLAQPQWVKDKWLRGNPAKRTLTSDGYAPQIGMRMRTRDGKAVVVIDFNSPTSTQPNQVTVVDLTTGATGKRAVSALVVDQEAELGGPEGSLPYISSVYRKGTGELDVGTHYPLPDGTVIYRAGGADYSGGRDIDLYFYLDEHGRIVKLSTGKVGSDTKEILTNAVTSGNLSKVAVIDGNSPLAAAYANAEKVTGADGKSVTKPTGFTIFDPAEFTAEEALSGHFADLYAPAIPGAPLQQPIKHENLVNLPKPAGVPEFDPTVSVPEPPIITGKAGNIDAKPDMPGGSSILGAARSVLASHGTNQGGSAAEYGIGDHEYVEDLMVRSQIARNVDTGQEYVELHFRMVEDKAEAAADLLMRTGKDTVYGKWVPLPEARFASKLKKGDAINVRAATMTGFLKPSNGDTPNVRLTADPEFLGTDDKGVKVYRLKVASTSGITGTMDVQERAMPSIRVFEWKPEAVAQQAGTISVSLTDKALTQGWIEFGNTIGYDSANGDFSLEADGTKIFNGKLVKTSAQSNPGQAGYGRRLHREFEDGSHVRFNAVPSSVSGLSSGGQGSSPGEIRRWNDAGLVTIRVPRELAETDPEAFKASVSRAMEAVGIPPDRQGPASPEYLAIFALGKVFKAHAPEFHHRQKGVVAANMNDAGVTTVFGRMNSELKSILGRDLNFDDVQIHFMEDGRMVVLMSEEVGKAIAQRQGNTFYTHRGASDFTRVTNILGGPTRGLMGGSERYSMGIFTTSGIHSPSSTYTDSTKGSGNRIYLSGKSHTTVRDSSVFVFNAAAIGRITDIYVNNSDGYGNRALNNPFLTHFEGHEFMVKGRIDPGMMSFFIAGSESTRQEIINFLHSKGVFEIGGRPVEEIVITGTMNVSDPAFQKAGISSSAFISVASLLKSLGGEELLEGLESVEIGASE